MLHSSTFVGVHTASFEAAISDAEGKAYTFVSAFPSTTTVSEYRAQSLLGLEGTTTIFYHLITVAYYVAPSA